MEIYLVRHTSVDIPAGYAYGQTDVPLRPSFEDEAEAVKKNLSGHTFDKVWSSPLTRCTRLAAYCGYPDAEKEDRIKEISFGEWEILGRTILRSSIGSLVQRLDQCSGSFGRILARSIYPCQSFPK